MKQTLRRHPALLLLPVLIGLLVLLFDDGGPAETRELAGFTMGTSYRFQLADVPDGLDGERLDAAVEALLLELDRGIFSTWSDASELSRFNRHPAGVPFHASAELLDVLELAGEISALSDGAFDVTAGALVNLWGFGPPRYGNEPRVPQQEQISQALARVGHRHLLVDLENSSVTKTRELSVDPGGIAKGHALDRVAEHLDALGIHNYFLELGGELKIKGFRPDGEAWQAALETPDATAPRVHAVLSNRGRALAVAGSGDYRNYFEQDGQRYSHQIDPRSGRPVVHNLAAAYVIDASAARADALATACMVLGLERARTMLEREGQAAWLVYRTADGALADYLSDAFRTWLESERE